MNKYCAIVVLYNPDKEVFQNVHSYSEDVECIYFIDNSITSYKDDIDKMNYSSKSIYVPFGKNYGLAYALNYGCKKAIKDGYTHALTMDQDSFFDRGAIKFLKNYMESGDSNCAIACPNVISLYKDEKKGEEKIAYQRWDKGLNIRQKWCMTSGSLMSLEAYNHVGGFDNEMFIAHLDIDLGLKLSAQGYTIMMIGDSIIRQHFGNSKPKKILFKTVHPSYASPVRTYYLFRNQKYLEHKYGKGIKKIIGVSLIKFFVKITLFEPQKIQKYKMMIMGISDAKKGIMGEYRG